MSDQIQGCDTSHWQGRVDWAKAYAKGIRFAGIKVSQGINYKDDQADYNSKAAQAAGVKIWPYHFVTTDSAAAQYNWFVQCVGGISVVWDLPPAMDTEYYNALTLENPREQEAVRLACMNPTGNMTAYYNAVRGLSIPTESIVDTIGRSMTTWMVGRPNMDIYKYPMIYTNQSAGNVVFKTAAMARYNLWIANWTTAATPAKPAVWKNEKYIVWQNYVIHGAQDWGVDGDLDHDIWGDKFSFPVMGTGVLVDFTIAEFGKRYSGRLAEVV